jgi:hypothetical protein
MGLIDSISRYFTPMMICYLKVKVGPRPPEAKLYNISFNPPEFHINAESSAPYIDTNKNSIETI